MFSKRKLYHPQTIASHFVFSRITLDFQGLPTRNVISQIAQKCTFPAHSNRTLRLELFAPPTSLHFSVQKQKKNTLCKSPLTSLSCDLYNVFCLEQPQSIKKKTFSRPLNCTFKVKENSRTFQDCTNPVFTETSTLISKVLSPWLEKKARPVV